MENLLEKVEEKWKLGLWISGAPKYQEELTTLDGGTVLSIYV